MKNREAWALARRVAPLFDGRPPEVVGLALADLTATLLASHFGENGAETAKLRQDLLDLHVRTVRSLIPVNEERVLSAARDRADA